MSDKIDGKDDLIGSRCNMLTVLEYSHTKNRVKTYLCRCDCGQLNYAKSDGLRSKQRISCGCDRKRKVIAARKKEAIHGKYKSRVYSIWVGMRKRCMWKKANGFHRYGGRGITVAPEWMDFEKFLADMGEPNPDQTLDRIDNDGPYSKENCRWATKEIQHANKCNNHWIEVHGQNFTIAQAAAYFKIRYSKLFDRIKRGWAPEKAVVDGGKR